MRNRVPNATSTSEAALTVDREIIHSTGDVSAVLKMAHGRGLIVRVDAPTESPEPDIATAGRLATFDRGVFMLFRPEWVFGEPQFQRIPLSLIHI